MILVSKLRQGWYDLPEEFIATLPDTCPSCGYPTVINSALTTLQCLNIRCLSKVVERTQAMAADLGVLGMGSALSYTFLTHFQTLNPLNLFDANTSLSLAKSSTAFYKVAEQMESIRRTRRFTLGEFVKIANLPYLRNTALKLLQGYSDLDSFYADLDSEGIRFIQKRLGIDSGASITAKNVYDTLQEFRSDLYEGVELVALEDLTAVKSLRVCISDSAGEGFSSKKDFMAQAASASSGYHLTFVDSVSKSLDALIWGGGRYTSKVKRVESYGGVVPIMSGLEFITALRANQF